MQIKLEAPIGGQCYAWLYQPPHNTLPHTGPIVAQWAKFNILPSTTFIAVLHHVTKLCLCLENLGLLCSVCLSISQSIVIFLCIYIIQIYQIKKLIKIKVNNIFISAGNIGSDETVFVNIISWINVFAKLFLKVLKISLKFTCHISSPVQNKTVHLQKQFWNFSVPIQMGTLRFWNFKLTIWEIDYSLIYPTI